MIGVLIVVYRPNVAELGAALDALAQAHGEGVALEVRLWHNDAGPDASPGLAQACERVRARGVPLTVAGGRGNLGFGRGVNALLGDVSAEYVLLLNQDAIPEPGALARLWHTARADAANVAAWEMRQIPYEHPKDYDPVTLDTEWCSGAAVLLRAAALRAVGGFEPRIFMYGEDVDLSWRLRCAGWRLRYLPRCAVVHRTYATPNDIKPLMMLGSVYANLALRTRFAGRRCVAQGVAMVLRELRGPQAFAGRRRGIVKALARFALNYAYFRRTRCAGPGFEPYFAAWDFERRREGAFHPFLATAEQAQPRPPVTLIVRSHGRPGFLRQALATVEGQTHRPLDVVVVEAAGGDGRAVCAEFETRLAIAHLPLENGLEDARGLERALAAARGQWVGVLDDDQRLYADHVEVLLQAALDTGAPGAVALAWRAFTRVVDERGGRFHEVRRDVWPDVPSDPAAPLPLVPPPQPVLLERRAFACLAAAAAPSPAAEWNALARVRKLTSLVRVPAQVVDAGGRTPASASAAAP